MNNNKPGFGTILIDQYKSALKNRILWFTIPALLVLSLVAVYTGSISYRQEIKLEKPFQEIENIKVKNYSSYRQYASYGYRILYRPAPISIFLNKSGDAVKMISMADGGERLRLDQPILDNINALISRSSTADFAWILFLFAGIISLPYGAFTFYDKAYIKMLASRIAPAKLFRLLYLARLTILSIIFLIVIALAWLIASITGFHIPIDSSLAFFILTVLSIVAFYFSIGMLPGAFKSKDKTYLSIFIMLIIVMFIIPTSFYYYTESRSSDKVSLEQLELKKLELLTTFQKKFVEKFGVFNLGRPITDEVRNTMKSYLENEWQKINAVEESLKSQTWVSIQHKNNTMMFSPPTFFMTSMSGLSSFGNENIFQFYSAAHESKKKFVNYYFHQLYFSKDGSDFKKIKNFITGDENIIKGKSRIVENAWLGFILTLVYTVIAAFFSFYLFRKQLFHIRPVDITANASFKYNIKKAELKHVIFEGNLLYNLFMGQYSRLSKFRFNGDLLIEGKPIEKLYHMENFLFICAPEDLPDTIQPIHQVKFIGMMMNVPKMEIKQVVGNLKSSINKVSIFRETHFRDKALVILSLLKMVRDNSIIMVPDLKKVEPPLLAARMIEQVEELKKRNISILSIEEIDPRNSNQSGNIIDIDEIDAAISEIKAKAEYYKHHTQKSGDEWEI